MKKHQIFLTLAILAIIVATIFCFTYFARSTKDIQPNLLQNQKQTQGQVNFTSKPVSSQEISEIASSSMLENVYTLREYKGHIGVFENARFHADPRDRRPGGQPSRFRPRAAGKRYCSQKFR